MSAENTVLVTGGSRGIGRAIALALAQDGFDLVVHCRSRVDEAEAVAAQARALGREFVDLDHELEARCGVRVPVIFEIEGEAGFRRREAAALEECTQRRNIILATGGSRFSSFRNANRS